MGRRIRVSSLENLSLLFVEATPLNEINCFIYLYNVSRNSKTNSHIISIKWQCWADWPLVLDKHVKPTCISKVVTYDKKKNEYDNCLLHNWRWYWAKKTYFYDNNLGKCRHHQSGNIHLFKKRKHLIYRIKIEPWSVSFFFKFQTFALCPDVIFESMILHQQNNCGRSFFFRFLF